MGAAVSAWACLRAGQSARPRHAAPFVQCFADWKVGQFGALVGTRGRAAGWVALVLASPASTTSSFLSVWHPHILGTTCLSHCVCPILSSTGRNDRAWKIRPVLDTLEQTFKNGYIPRSSLSFDEGMLPPHSKFNRTRMYMMDTPHNWGETIHDMVSRTSYCMR